MTPSPVSADARARVRAAWATLAGVGEFPRHGPFVAVRPTTRICPPGWAGVVGLDGGVVATVPDQKFVEPFTRALEALDPVGGWSAFDPGVPVLERRGPAALAYADDEAFRHAAGAGRVDQLEAAGARLARFVASVPEDDAEEAGLMSCTSPPFVVVDDDHVVAAAAYRVWCDALAHMSVLVAPARRGAGLARAVGRAATEHALAQGLVAQWRAVPPASRAVAAALGYESLGWQVSLHV